MISLEEMIFKAFSSLIGAVIPWQCTRFTGAQGGAGAVVELGLEGGQVEPGSV